jgi:hypothetical protein
MDRPQGGSRHHSGNTKNHALADRFPQLSQPGRKCQCITSSVIEDHRTCPGRV